MKSWASPSERNGKVTGTVVDFTSAVITNAAIIFTDSDAKDDPAAGVRSVAHRVNDNALHWTAQNNRMSERERISMAVEIRRGC